MSDSSRWARVKDVFQAALEQDLQARTAFLDQACAEDPVLRREVESLLVSHAEVQTRSRRHAWGRVSACGHY